MKLVKNSVFAQTQQKQIPTNKKTKIIHASVTNQNNFLIKSPEAATKINLLKK